MLNEDQAKNICLQLTTVFQPSCPISAGGLFAGRSRQVEQIVDAINQRGRHAIVYGERGVGKTSLTYQLSEKLVRPGANKLVAFAPCSSRDSYASVFQRVMADIEHTIDSKSLSVSEPTKELIRRMAEPMNVAVDAGSVVRVMQMLFDQNFLVVVVIDEFDLLAGTDAAKLISETIKHLSDRRVFVTVVLVGVAESIVSLIEDHESVDRCLSQIPMPKMDTTEMVKILEAGYSRFNMSISDDAALLVGDIARGFPHYVHLLGLESGRIAVRNHGELNVGIEAVKQGIVAATETSQGSLLAAFNKATTSSNKVATFRPVLTACAMANTDELGWFYTNDVRRPLSRINGKDTVMQSYIKILAKFCADERGPVLMTDGAERNPRYRFCDSMMPPFVMMKAAAEGMVKIDEVFKRGPGGRLF